MPHPAGSFTESPPTATSPPAPLLGTLRPADVGFSIERFEYVAASDCRALIRLDGSWPLQAAPPLSAPALAIEVPSLTKRLEPLADVRGWTRLVEPGEWRWRMA